MIRLSWRERRHSTSLPTRDETAQEPSARISTGLIQEFCHEAAKKLKGDAADHVRRIEAELADPQLRIAMLGRVSSGKSTCVNALLGRRMAPTDASECTRVVTCFRYGQQPSAVAHLRGGGSRDLPMPAADGRLPDLPASGEEVSYLEIRLPAAPLREVTLIDTPGVSSADSDVSRQTHELVSTRTTGRLPTPDAVAFVLNQSLKEDEHRLLQDVDQSNTLMPASVQTVGILAKADLIGGGGPGAWTAARTLARSIGRENRALLATVVPLMSLLAETGNCTRLTEQDAYLIRSLAREWDYGVREVALLSADMLTKQRSSVTVSERRHLLGMLGLAGLRELLQSSDDGLVSATALNATCSNVSGYDELRIALVHNFRERADVLKAARALSALVRAAYGQVGRLMSPQERNWFQDRLEIIRLDRRTHRIFELEALHRVLAGQVVLHESLQRDLVAMVEHPDSGTSGLGPKPWQELEVRATSAGQRAVARVMLRSYAISAEEM